PDARVHRAFSSKSSVKTLIAHCGITVAMTATRDHKRVGFLELAIQITQAPRASHRKDDSCLFDLSAMNSRSLLDDMPPVYLLGCSYSQLPRSWHSRIWDQ